MANEFTNGEQRRIEDIAQEQMRRDVTSQLGAFANRVSSPSITVTPPQSPIIQSETTFLGGSSATTLLPETKTPEAFAEIPPNQEGNIDDIQVMNWSTGTATPFVDTWDRTTGKAVSWKGTRTFRDSGTPFDVIITVTPHTTTVVGSTSSSSDNALAVSAVTDVYVFPFAASTPSVYTDIARAASSGTQYTVPKWGGPSEGSVKTVDFAGSSVTNTSQPTLIQTTATDKNVNVYAAGGVATVPNASGVVGTKVSLINTSSTVSLIASVTDNTTDVVDDVTTTERTLTPYTDYTFSREETYDNRGALYSIGAEFIVSAVPNTSSV